MNPAAFNGIFTIARTPGLIAHVIEEQTRERPMRRIDPVNHGYDGRPEHCNFFCRSRHFLKRATEIKAFIFKRFD